MTAPWNPPDRPIPVEYFGSLEPEIVLVDYGYPILFTSRTAARQQLLVFHMEEATTPRYAARYLAAPTTEATLDDLKSGRQSIHQALTQSWLWVVDKAEDGSIARSAQVEVSDLPDDALPAPTTMVSPDLEPALTIKYVGHSMPADAVKASILQAAGAGVQSALRVLTDFLAGQIEPAAGRRENRYRQLYNLPVQRIAFGSLEIGFRRPTHGAANAPVQEPLLQTGGEPVTTEELERRMWRMLRTGLRWLDSRQETRGLRAESDDERLAILRALEKLTPSTDSVDELIIGGSEVIRSPARSRYRIDKDAKKAVEKKVHELQTELETVHEQRIFKGKLVRAFDLDERTFTLRTQAEIDAGGGGIEFELVDDADVELVSEANHRPVPVVVMASRMVSRKKKDNPPWEVVRIELDLNPDASEAELVS